MKYSVIIPIYQAEKTINRCLNSLSSLEERDVEILMIDDGSTDRSGDICKEFCSRDPRFHYYHQSNKGVSSARNRGLDVAKGEYVLFVDCDDYVSEQYFTTFNTVLDTGAWDLIDFGIERISQSRQQFGPECGTYHGPVQVARYASKRMFDNSFAAVWAKLYSNRIISTFHLRFFKDLSIAEDIAFVFSYLCHVQQAITIDQVLYYVDESNMDSLSRKERPYLADHLYRATESMFQNLELAQLPREAKKLLRKPLIMAHYRSVYSVAKELQKSVLTAKERKRMIKKTCIQYMNPFHRPEGVKPTIVALPVIFHLSGLIDSMGRHKALQSQINMPHINCVWDEQKRIDYVLETPDLNFETQKKNINT